MIQCNLLQCERDYDYWNELYADKEAYRKKKQELADEVLQRLETRVSQYQGKIKLLDIWTPVTYHRFCNAYYEAYMGFTNTKRSKSATFTGVIKGLDNVVLASQWLMNPGGLPVAAIMGKFAIQRITKNMKKG